MPLTPKQRSLRARLAVERSWANTRDPKARTKAAREVFKDRFRDEVDPDRVLPEDERERRAEHALRAHMTALAFKSSRARSQAGQERREAEPEAS